MKFSDLARPPITEVEARAAQTSICHYHNGLVNQTGDVEGAVFLCPVGRQYWRYTAKHLTGMHSPLPYPKSGAV